MRRGQPGATAADAVRFGPYFIEPVIAGIQDGKPYVAGMDLIGAKLHTTDFIVSGTCTEPMFGVCESFYEPEMVPPFHSRLTPHRNPRTCLSGSRSASSPPATATASPGTARRSSSCAPRRMRLTPAAIRTRSCAGRSRGGWIRGGAFVYSFVSLNAARPAPRPHLNARALQGLREVHAPP